MPMYDFRCGACNKVEEKFCSYESLKGGFECECGGHQEYAPSFWYTSEVAAQRFAPVVIHRDAEGNVRFPGHTNAPVPEGFQKVELRDIRQIRALEKEMNLRDSVQHQEFNETQRKFREGQLAENRRAMEAILGGGEWKRINPETGHEETLHGLTPRGRAFYEAMRKASEHTSQHGHSKVPPEFYVEAFTQNASNREDHRDATSEWNRVRK